MKLPPRRPFAPASPLTKDAKKKPPTPATANAAVTAPSLEPRSFSSAEAPTKIITPRVVAPKVAPPKQDVVTVADPATPRDRIISEASALSEGLYGYFLWIEQKCTAAGMHPCDPQWLWHFREFYESGKMIDVGRFGLRAGKSVSVPRALAAEVLLVSRRLEKGQVGVCPIMAQNMREAADRFSTMRQILHACGLVDNTGHRTEDEEGFVCSGGGSTALKIVMRDFEGHDVEVRVYPASISGAAGFTGIAGFCDELDLWGRDEAANPAKRVVEILTTRYTTQPQAKLHLMSATYNPKSAHAEMIAAGDTPLQRVARLGAEGAKKDEDERSRLARSFSLADKLLTEKADPQSTDIPSWVSNPITPIEECYKKSGGDLRRMFALYGARVASVGGAKMSADDYLWIASQNNTAARPAITITGEDIGTPEHDIISGKGRWGDGMGGTGGGGVML
jgi:hypothetical protein